MPLDLFGGGQTLGMRFRDISLKVCISNHFGNVRASSRVAEKTLGEEKDELTCSELVYVTKRLTDKKDSQVCGNHDGSDDEGHGTTEGKGQ
jgi:hypothetical protein